MCELLTELLGQAGHRCAVARTATEAERLSAGDRPDVVVVDRNLPDRPGMVLVAALRARDPALPVVMISGAVGDPERAEAAAAGVELLAKPFDHIGLLAAAVERALAGAPCL